MFFFFMPIEYPSFGPQIDKLQAGLGALTAERPQMSISTLSTLLYVGRHQKQICEEKLSLAVLADQMAVPYTSLTRHADILGEGIGKRGGLGLVERAIDPQNSRGRILVLTKKGEAVIRQIEAAMIE